jgi:transcription antitermination factor NusG
LPYVLSPCEPAIDLTALERVTAIMDVVRTYSGSPLLLRDRDLAIIRRIDVTMNTPKPDATAHNFKTGHKVKFKDDLSAQWPPGVITKIAKDGRISAEVNMMGRKVPITVFPHQIERI